MSNYTHPILGKRDETMYGSGVYDVIEAAIAGRQGEVDRGKITHDIDEFLDDLRKAREYRMALGIPLMTYHAYMFRLGDYDRNAVRYLFEYARSKMQEVRVWQVPESAMLIVCVADVDTSEDTGMGLYTAMQRVPFESYGLASWWEFCAYGVPVPQDYRIQEQGEKLCAVSLDGNTIIYMD